MDKPLIIAHRGERLLAPENTIEGCRLALQQGASALEVDIRLCGSGEIVLFHDKTLHRNFNHYKIASFTSLAEFKAMHFNSVEFKVKASVATLQEFLEEFKGSVPINLDVKTFPASQHQLVRTLVKVLEDMHVVDQVWISAFNPYVLRLLKQAKSGLRTGYLFRNFVRFQQFIDALTYSDAWHPHFSIVNDMLMQKARAAHKEVYIWTVNDPSVAESLQKYNVQGLITDKLFKIKPL